MPARKKKENDKYCVHKHYYLTPQQEKKVKEKVEKLDISESQFVRSKIFSDEDCC